MSSMRTGSQSEDENIEDIYRLSPLQRGILFHCLYAPDSGVYFEQLSWTILDNLDTATFEHTWRHVMDRHPILRTTFWWEDLDEPLQLVNRNVVMPVAWENWCHLAPTEQEAQLATVLEADRRRGFDLTSAPLMHVLVIQTDARAYRLIWSYHHLLLDGQSAALVLAELSTSYAAFQRGENPALHRPRPYRDYIAWLRKQDLAQAEEFWRRTLRGFTVPTPLQVDCTPGDLPSQDKAYAQQKVWLSVAATRALQSLSQQQHVTLNTLLQGSWAVLLSRYSGEDDIVYGATVSGRSPSLDGSDIMVGLFINTLPVRVRVPPDAGLWGWLKKLQSQQIELLQYEYSPLVAIQQWSEVPRGVPLFETIVVFENYLSVASEHVQIFQRTNYPLTLVVEPGTSLALRISYDCRRFDNATITRMLGHLQVVLQGMTTSQEQRLADLPLLTAAEHHQMLVEWNATDQGGRGQGSGVRRERSDSGLVNFDSWCVHQLFATQAARTPDAVALVFDRGQGSGVRGQRTRDWGLGTGDWETTSTLNPQSPIPNPQLTYSELNTRANRLAHYLHSLGVGPELLVGVAMERSPELVIGLLGVLKTGGAYVSLDPAFPRERMAFMLADAQVVVLLTQHHLVEHLPNPITDQRSTTEESSIQNPKSKIQNPVVLCLDSDWATIGQERDDNLHSGVASQNLAYVIYTSGSTGKPKGTLISHGNVSRLFAATEDWFHFDAHDVWTLFHSYAFDFSVWELWGALLYGGRLVVVPALVSRSFDLFYQLLCGEQVTVLNQTPSAFGQIVHAEAAMAAASDLALRLVIFGGEALEVQVLQPWFDRHGDRVPQLVNMYGITETTVHVTYRPISRADLQTSLGSMIGRSIPDMQLYVLDRYLRPVPIGVPGELYVGGAGGARGYLNRPDLTAERFIPNPFAQALDDGCWVLEDILPTTRHPLPNTRLYRTGDLVRYQADGDLVYLGRIDQQVKIRGFRIELGEIEATLVQHPAVREALVLAREDVPGDKRLVAYVVTSDELQVTSSQDSSLVTPRSSLVTELRRLLEKTLPAYMVPSAFLFLEALPLTSNGKVDRRALPAPDGNRSGAEQTFVAPRRPLEDMLATIWSQVLGVTQVGIHDNFFALGGHSLLVTQLIGRVRQAFQVELSLRHLFEMPTIARLAEYIETAQRNAQGLLAPPIQPISREQALPLSFAQQRLWLLDQLEPHSPTYTIPAALRLIGALDTCALQQSLSVIMRRHEALRTTFRLVAEQPAQVIAPPAPMSLPLIDLQDVPAQEQEDVVVWLASVEAQRSFDLTRGPLVTANLLRLCAAEHVLLLTLHHIIADGWSVGVFTQELSTLYAAYTAGRPLELPELPIQYADYAVWQRTWLHGAVLEAQLAYWKGQLADLPVLELPTDHPRPPTTTFRGALESFILPAELSASLLELSRQEGVTLFQTLLAAFQTLLARYSGQDDIVVGTPIANRTSAETEHLIGCFVNTVVLRADLAGNPSFREALRRVSDLTLAAYAHQELPFEQLVEALQPPRDLSRHPLFQVMCTLEHAPLDALALPNLTIQPLTGNVTSVKFDLSLSMVETAVGLAGRLEYRSDLFEADTMTRLHGHFRMLLAAIVAVPDRRLADLPLLTEMEQQQLLVEWSAPTIPTSPHQCLHHLVASQAARTPDTVALIMDRPTTRGQGSGVRGQRSGDRGQGDREIGYYDETQHPAPIPHPPSPIPHPPSPSTRHLTYRELEVRANQLAHYLQQHGIGPEAPVGLCLERSPDLVVALLAILKSGGVYLPLDPAYPEQRLAFMLQDAQAALLLTRQRLCARLPSAVVPVVSLDTAWPAVIQQPPTPPPGLVQPSHLAYLIYTSGTTGTPKAVMVEHRSIVNTMYAVQMNCDLRPGDQMVCLASFAFDIALFECLAPLTLGGAAILLTERQILDLPSLAALLPRLNFLHMMPSLMGQVVRYLYERNAANPAPNLRGVLIGGDAIPSELVRQLQTILPATQLYLGYGPTETSIISTVYPVPREQTVSGSLIGRPLTNMQVRLYDRRHQLVPIGVPGEIHIGGAGVARGYLNRPDLTAERFIPNPFAQVLGDGCWVLGVASSNTQHPSPNTRLYRTGDLARYRPDGTLEFLGRIDDQVKVRGFRIEPGEIATVLRRHPAVREAIVVVREDVPGDMRLVAYVVTSHKSQVTSSSDSSLVTGYSSLVTELRCFLQNQLPAYMIPAAFVLLEALPLTSTGKIDRRALPAPSYTGSDLGIPFSAPRSWAEEVLANMWAALLGVERVGVHDDFFTLGGHSLLATQLIFRIRAAFNVELPLRSLFETPTVAALAERIVTAQREAEGSLPPPIPLAPRDGPLPLSFAQQRLWFLDQLEPGNTAYTIPAAVQLRGLLDGPALARSLAALVARHETLRTTIALADGQAVQVIAPPRQLPLPLLDLQSLPPAARATMTRYLAQSGAQQPFDLARGPLIRVTLLRLEPDEHVLLLYLHHIIADGWSMGVFIRELGTLYAAYAIGQTLRLPPLPIQYADYAVWQREWLRGAVRENLVAYWRRQLAHLPALRLPTDHPYPQVATFQGRTQQFALPAQLSRQLGALSRQAGVTLFMTLLAAWQVLLARYSDQDDIVVGTPIANRMHVDTEGLIGFFVNTLVLRTRLAGTPAFWEVLQQVREICLEAYAHQDLPFEQLVEVVQPERDLSRQPLFQVMLVLQNAPAAPLELPGLVLCPLNIESTVTKFDLTLSLVEGADGLIGVLEYRTDLFDATTIERMSGHFQVLLAGIAADPAQGIADLPLLTGDEWKQLVIDWNTPRIFYQQDRCIHQLFEAQAQQSPDVIALIFEDQQLTYHELNRRANRLAHHLRTLGVGPEVLVGLCLEPSLDQLLALLAILKAGGAYLPLDPTYPQERLAFLLHDARPAVLITSSLPPPAASHQRLTSDELRRQSTLHNPQSTIVELDAEWPTIARLSPASPGSAASPHNLAYLLYTSGSTGQPKGVLISHANVVRLLAATAPLFQFGSCDVWTLFHALTFDFSVWEVLGALLSGARLVLLPYLLSRSPGALAQLLARQRVSVLNQTPSAFYQLLPFLPAAQARQLALRLVILGGEALEVGRVLEWSERQGASAPQLVNMYGLTEATVHATYAQLGAQGASAREGSLVGRRLGDLAGYILDRELRVVPLGVAGELYLSGDGLARGYHRRPDLTAERFLPNPFAQVRGEGCWVLEDKAADTHPPTPNTRLYKTGDRMRYREDGGMEYLGRQDRQVKVRGYRIEPGEVEAALRQHEGVSEAVVVGREVQGGGLRLVAYVVTSTKSQVTSAQDWSLITRHSSLVTELREFLAARLPRYMLPAAFVRLEALPLTPHGKLDYRALPAPDTARPALENAFVAPHTPAEKVLATIWAQVLGIEQVGINDNFFALGGDSIKSLQVIARANQSGLYFTPKQLFQHQTIAEIAAIASTMTTAVAEQGLVEGALPLTPIQRWFFEQQLPDPHHWNQALLLEVQQPLAPALIEQVVMRLMEHHDALRLRFVFGESGWQSISAAPDAQVPFTHVDLSTLSQAAQRAAIETQAAEFQASLNLAAGPLLRVVYFDLGRHRPARLLIVIHHLAVDGVSWRIILEDLQLAYLQLGQGQAPALPPKTTSFRQWAERLVEYAQSPVLRQEVSYWLARPQARIARLPVDYPSELNANTRASARRVASSLSVEETHALLHEVHAAYHTQINDILLTALAQTFSPWTTSASLLIDLEGHGREQLFDDIDLSRTVGWCTTIFPVLLDMGKETEPGEALKRIKEQLRAIPRRGIGYGLLHYLSGDQTSIAGLRGQPQPEVSFNYLGQIDQLLRDSALFRPAPESSGATHSPRGSRRHLLEINGLIVGKQLQFEWIYSENLHRRLTIERLAERFVAALRSLIDHCLAPESGGYTPADFPKMRLSQAELDGLIAQLSQEQQE